MKKKILLIGLIGLLAFSLFFAIRAIVHIRPAITDVVADGDIIFQTSKSKQSKAIQLATHSRYSHCGIIFKEGNSDYVLEGVQPVRMTPLYKFLARADSGHYVVKRLINATTVLTPAVIDKMKKLGDDFKGKDYDRAFEWTDTKIYCSELVWKIYKRATGIEIGKLQHLRDFDLTSDIVKREMVERYGDSIPMNEIVISPSSIFESKLLTTVISY